MVYKTPKRPYMYKGTTHKTLTPRIEVTDSNDNLSIPVPMMQQRARGRNSTSQVAGRIITRVSLPDQELIKDEAAWLDITPSQFIRWVTLHAAKALKERREGRRVAIEI